MLQVHAFGQSEPANLSAATFAFLQLFFVKKEEKCLPSVVRVDIKLWVTVVSLNKKRYTIIGLAYIAVATLSRRGCLTKPKHNPQNTQNFLLLWRGTVVQLPQSPALVLRFKSRVTNAHGMQQTKPWLE